MAEIKLLADTAAATVIDTNSTLADGVRATVGDLNNDGTTTDLDIWCIPFLQVQYDVTAPTAGDEVAKLWVLPADGAGTEVFVSGGVTNAPASNFYVGSFFSVVPSTTTDEILGLTPFKLYPDSNRFVIENVSGTTFDSTWQLSIRTFKYQSV